jgi:probable rRNA maturation factor
LRELSVALVGERRMASLHEAYLNVNGPTDVLTFPLETDGRGNVIAGEIVICIPEARQRSRRERTSLRDEVLLYALHGMLHLCGFDDRTEAGFTAMHRAEDEILTRLGVGPVFEPPKRPRPGKTAGRRRSKTPRRTDRAPGAY